MSRYIPTLKAWPLGTPLPRNGMFVFYDPAQDDEFRVTPEQLATEVAAPAPGDGQAETNEQLYARFQVGNGLDLALLPSGKIFFNTKAQQVVTPTAPLAPISVQVNDVTKTWLVRPNPLYPSASQYQITGLPGTSGPVYLDTLNSYLQDGLLAIPVEGGVSENGLALYVAGSGNRPDGRVLTNPRAFTGPVIGAGTDILGNISTAKAAAGIPAYQAAGGPFVETDPLFYGQEFTDDYTQEGDEFFYACKPRRPVAAGQPTVWKWGRYLEAGV